MKFRPIPASRDEAREVAGMLKRRFGSEKTSGPSLLLGPEATEEAFKRLAAKQRVIHLATHAFVAGEEGENPFQLSGLALAGANDRRCRATRGLEDGLLMADEITSQDLSGAEWVVLSACETGLGPIQAGEGVQGLRRAFEIAGARTLVMSLWAMDDQATRDWMKSLYQSRLAGASWPEALRGASLSHIASRRQAGLSTDPFYWGSFVATGDWR